MPCVHGRQRSRCKDCGGSGICEHGRERRQCKDCGGSGICAIDYECGVCNTGPPAPELSRCECNPLFIRGFKHGGRGKHSKYATEIKTAMVLADALMLPSDDEESDDDNDASFAFDELQAVPIVGGGVIMVPKPRTKPEVESLTKPVAKKPKRDEGVAGSSSEHAHNAMPHE